MIKVTNINALKSDFAFLHQLMAHFEWTDVILTHLSVRVNHELFLFSPFSVLFEDVTADNVVLIDSNGNQPNGIPGLVNPAGLTTHQAIYNNRPDVQCIIHTHTDDGVAASCLPGELLIYDQMSFMFHEEIAYHDFTGINVDFCEQQVIAQDLGNKKCLIMRHHGLLCTGNNIADAFWHYYYLEKLCKINIKLLACRDKMVNVSDKVKNKTKHQHKQFNEGSGLLSNMPGNSELAFSALKKNWKR